MRTLLILTGMLFFISQARPQTPVGSWSDHLMYTSIRNIAISSNEVYASTGSSLLVYNKQYDELRKLSRINGLTETGIRTIAWSAHYEMLIVAYSTTNIDLIKNNNIYNLPDISRKYIPGKKEINRIRINGRYAYLACSFGIVLIDLGGKEIYDTWKPGDGSGSNEVWDVAFGDGKVYAATGTGIFSGNISDPGLAYFGNWQRLGNLPSPSGKYNLAIFSGNRLFVNRTDQNFPSDSIYSIDAGCSLFSSSPGLFNSSMDPGTTGFTVSSGSSVRHYQSDGTLLKTIATYNPGNINAVQAIEENGNLWIADINSGLIKENNSSQFTAFNLSGPVSNNAVSISSLNGKTIVCGGGVDASWNNLWRPLQLSVNENDKWIPVTSQTLFDPLRVLIDPSDNNHFFVATWGTGLLEFENNILKNQFTEANSPLQTIIPGKPFVRICGLAMDKQKNLWITQNEVPGSIKILKPDGTWIVNPATVDVPTIGDIIISRSGIKWIVLPRGRGLFILDDNNSPGNFSDDETKEMLVTDSENKVISYVYCITEDLDGNIWIGTDQGPLIYYNPDNVLDDDIKAFRIKIPRNDGSGLADYMLGTETITSIAVDGANRKWLGTQSSGVYLLSSDGTKKLKNFDEGNSPLFSNTIAGISVDNKTGNVWFATSKGIISVRGDATEGGEKFSGVYSFPNPVREDYSGNVTITGLMRDTQIRITDVSGNLVYKTTSDGGSATWDLTTYTGSRVSTGVYVVFCASSDGTQSAVTKILVIN